MGIGNWGVGCGDWGLGPIPNPQSPIPNKEFEDTSIINLNNEILVSEHKTNPETDYKKIQFLGKGTFASVFEVKDKITGIQRAMKTFKKINPLLTEKQILNEISILIQMDHPNIFKNFFILFPSTKL